MIKLISFLERLSDTPLTRKELLEIVEKYVESDVVANYINSRLAISTELRHDFLHQLGFYKFCVQNVPGLFPRRVRLHYWQRTKVRDDVHDHAYSFASKVLYGSLVNEIYQEKTEGERFFYKQFRSLGQYCVPTEEIMSESRLSLLKKEEVSSPLSYYVHSDELHCVKPLSNELITLVVQDIPSNSEINVFRRASLEFESAEAAIQLTSTQANEIFQRMSNLLRGLG